MPSYSKSSKSKLETCDPRLQDIFNEVIQIIDHTIVCGHRGEKDQNEAYQDGKSKLPWPKGKHNKNPSLAVDVAPYPVNWNDHTMFYLLAGVILGVAHKKGIPLRWGGMWDGLQGGKSKFQDLGHFEIQE